MSFLLNSNQYRKNMTDIFIKNFSHRSIADSFSDLVVTELCIGYKPVSYGRFLILAIDKIFKGKR